MFTHICTYMYIYIYTDMYDHYMCIYIYIHTYILFD